MTSDFNSGEARFACFNLHFLQSDLDNGALDALKVFPTEDAIAVLAQFLWSNLEHKSNQEKVGYYGFSHFLQAPRHPFIKSSGALHLSNCRASVWIHVFRLND